MIALCEACFPEHDHIPRFSMAPVSPCAECGDWNARRHLFADHDVERQRAATKADKIEV